MTERPPHRVLVTGPTRSNRGRLARSAADETAADANPAHIRALMRAQLWAGAVVGGLVCGCLVALPLLFAMVPAVGRLRLWGMPLPWLVLGLVVYPVLVVAAAVYVRLAERTERRFLDTDHHP